MLNLLWLQNGELLTGYNYQANTWEYGQLNYGLLFPGILTPAQSIVLKSSGAEEEGQVLQNIRFYLDGDQDELQEIQFNWPGEGGGLQVSFDGGATYNTFSSTYGNKADSTTWPILPASAIGVGANNGELGPYDSATLLFRYQVPANPALFEVFTLHIEASVDVI